MSKKVWFQPQAVAEQFVANEYVAACWVIECAVPDKMGGFDGFNQDRGGHRNRNGACGSRNSQYIQDAGKDLYTMYENSSVYGTMECLIYPQGIDFENKKVNGTGVKKFTLTEEQLINGTKLYWTTTATGGYPKYYHYGYISLTEANRAQHS